jgi:hypothetical protein
MIGDAYNPLNNERGVALLLEAQSYAIPMEVARKLRRALHFAIKASVGPPVSASSPRVQ